MALKTFYTEFSPAHNLVDLWIILFFYSHLTIFGFVCWPFLVPIKNYLGTYVWDKYGQSDWLSYNHRLTELVSAAQ